VKRPVADKKELQESEPQPEAHLTGHEKCARSFEKLREGRILGIVHIHCCCD